ncbi:hypothetical protein N0V90_010461 [Kalmusia sp. IMI 367209]|nr:hypothetical protein N0V90_010461 [Kalmusia sp. IMI 367209]
MAAGSDELLDFLLSGIAFCGVQGASSADFRRIINEYYQHSHPYQTSSGSGVKTANRPKDLGRTFYEQAWLWVTEHPDVRILYQRKARSLSLSEFEALELQEGDSNAATLSEETAQQEDDDLGDKPVVADHTFTRPSGALSSLGSSLRQRLASEGACSDNDVAPRTKSGSSLDNVPATPVQHQQMRDLRKIPSSVQASEPAFEEPPDSLKAPRLFASQNRIWKALTGHPIDLKKVPGSEFVLLSIIATSGPDGISQPVLQKLSGQDKRSVPHRTDELARKGYIQKSPLQVSRAKTSLCKHKRFAEGLLAEPRSIDDVFGIQTFELTGFVYLLDKLLQTTNVVQVRNLRERMGVSVDRWNGRAVRGALLRLEQTHFLKRLQVKKRRKDPRSKEDHIVCIKGLREANEDDVKNLKFKGTVTESAALETIEDEPLEDDNEGDGFMRDMELELMDELGSEDDDDFEESGRIPPQWTPDQLLPNLVFDATQMAGLDGLDAERLRNKTTGIFWKRPIESVVSRMTDGWDKSQPPHVRHLAIVRDTSVTKEKKRVFYVYRTYENFQKAVDAGEVTWEALGKEVLSKSVGSKKQIATATSLDRWGFSPLNAYDFHRRTGSSSLAEACSAIVRGRRAPRDWEGKLLKEKDPGTPGSTHRQTSLTPTRNSSDRIGGTATPARSTAGYQVQTPKISKIPRPLLTMDERLALGLPARGRLGEDIEGQIRAHRRKTGNPNSIPDKLVKGLKVDEPKPAPRYARRPGPPLLTREQRKARGLPETGRLSFKVTEQILREQGRKESLTHMKNSMNNERSEGYPLLEDDQGLERSATPLGSVYEQLQKSEDAGSFTGSGNSEEEMISESRNSRSPMVLEENGSYHDVPEDVRQPSIEASAGSGSLHDPTANRETPRKRKYQKQPTGDHEVKAGRPIKKARSNNKMLAVDSMSLLQGDLSGRTGLSLDEPMRDKEQGTVISDILPYTATPEVHRSTALPMSVSEGERVVINFGESDSAPQSLKSTSKKRGRPPQKATSQVSPRPLTESELHIQVIRTKYANRVEPGLYINPFATRSSAGMGGRGRPKKVFLATFKLPSLRTLEWFKDDPTQVWNVSTATSTPKRVSKGHFSASKKAVTTPPASPGAHPAPETDPAVSVEISTDVLRRQSLRRDLPMTLVTATESQFETAEQTEVTVPVVETSQADPVLDSTRPLIEGLRMEADESSVVKMIDEPLDTTVNEAETMQMDIRLPEVSASIQQGLRGSDNDYDPVSQSPVAMMPIDSSRINQQLTNEQSRTRARSSPSSRHPLTWRALNTTLSAHSAPYRSPYSLTSAQTPFPIESPNRAAASMTDIDVTAHDMASYDMPGIDGTSQTTPIVEDRNSRGTPVDEEAGTPVSAAILTELTEKKSKIVRSRGVVLGKGSVSHSRAFVIRHILDLCGGAFPANGEIYSIFESVWEQLGPKKIACPNQATLRKSLTDMCNAASDLRKLHFSVPGTDLGGNTNKAIFAYKHLTISSPEVRKIMNGIIQAYPHKYWPPEVQHFWKEAEKPALVLPEIDDSVADELYAPTVRRLEERMHKVREERQRVAREIKAAKEEHKRVAKEAERARKRAAKETEKELKSVDKEQSLRETESGGQSKKSTGSRKQVLKKRERLFSLNDALQSGGKPTKKPLPGPSEQRMGPATVEAPQPAQRSREHSPASESSDDELLVNMLPKPPQAVIEDQVVTTASLLGSQSSAKSSNLTAALMDPTIRYYSANHTFSTDFIISAPTAVDSSKKGRKRVRIEKPSDRNPRKRPRKVRSNSQRLAKTMEEFLVRHRSEIDESSDEEDTQSRPDEAVSPTIAERLAGLTGDPNEPDYEPVRKKRRGIRGWTRAKSRKDRKRKHNVVKDRRYPEVFDPLAEFRKLCFTLVIASSMTGDAHSIDWNIVSSVYTEDCRFDLKKTKKMWAWMQTRMALQLRSIAESFQACFLNAYEEEKVDPIEDPGTYDWAKLVRWALLSCSYQEPPLPLAREALNDCQFDISSYEILDRSVWYNTTLTSINREERFAKYTFGSPLHERHTSSTQGSDDSVKARSLIRANISTPKELYDKIIAHDKLRELPKSILESTVTDLVRASLIRMRTIKRLKPGRNYLFTSHFAKHYRRTLELSDFMTAVKLKKDLDITFADPNPEKRTFSISRTAECGTVMAIMSLVSEGKVKLVPKLPPIKNEFGAPLPRISVWGYSEGDYLHRLMDRQRLFWPMEVVPTATYEFGNPLQPMPSPLAPNDVEKLADWNHMPEPPLPGRHNPSALLPVWSTIDGQSPIYPWWNRILNIVIQALLFQPGNTAHEIHTRCEPYTTEVFEIQLVLDWLVSVKAASHSPHGSYELLPGYWAIFGDCLVDEDRDDFGEHVKRNATNKKLVPTWRTEYNLRYSMLRQGDLPGQEGDVVATGSGIREHISENPRSQYRIAREDLNPPTVVTQGQSESQDQSQDEGEDVDAEGEWDDEYS